MLNQPHCSASWSRRLRCVAWRASGDQRGQSTVEYALILVAVATIAAQAALMTLLLPLLAGLLDGTIDMIATDHAPHSAEEKAKGLRGSAMGVVGIETAFPLLYTYLVETGKMPLEMLIDRMADAP